MGKLEGKHVLLGVTGGIAAYKTAVLTRMLIRAGAEVQCVMTEHAKEFITPLTLATLSKRSIMVDFFDPTTGAWNSHVKLGLWADVYVIAPATANTIGKMAHGIADNLLLTTYLSAKCPVVVAPAMDRDMYAHPTTRENLKRLESYGNHIVEPREGFLASGLEGKGRMEEPDGILRAIEDALTPKTLQGKRVLITAGPTQEAIDPVRYIGNRSTGKMGYAIAEEAARRGAMVVVVSGPTALQARHENISVVHVESAAEMAKETKERFAQADAAVLSAAVADYRAETIAEEKIKRQAGEELNLVLKPTEDIAAALGKMKIGRQLLAGFALETQNERENAIGKLKRKNFDFIVLNSLRDGGAGFGYDTNKVSIIDKDGRETDYPLKSKDEVAEDIVTYLEERL